MGKHHQLESCPANEWIVESSDGAGKHCQLEPYPVKEWVIDGPDGLVLRDPITLGHIEDVPAYVEYELAHDVAFWKSHEDISLTIEVGSMMTAADLGEPGVFEERVRRADMYGIGIPLQGFDAPDGFVNGYRDRLVGAFQAASTEKSPKLLFNYGRAPSVYTPMAHLLNNMIFLADDYALRSGQAQTGAESERARNRAFGVEMVALVSLQRWVMASRVTAALREVYNQNSAKLKKKDSVDVYMHLDPSYAMVPDALYKLGIPHDRLHVTGRIDTWPAKFQSLVHDIARTSTITNDQLEIHSRITR